MPQTKQSLTIDLTGFFIAPGCDWSSKAIIAALERQGVTLQEIERELVD